MLKKIWEIVKSLNVIVFMLLFGFSVALHIRYRDNVVFKNLCKDKFRDDYMICYHAPKRHNVSGKELEVLKTIQTSNNHVFGMITLKVITEFLFSGFLCSYSDSCGRKFPLLIALIGENLDIFYFFFRDFPFMYFISLSYILTALSGLFGGYVCIFTMAYCFLTDSSESESRTVAFTLIDFTYVFGIVTGVTVFKKLMVGDLLTTFYGVFGVRCILILWVWQTFEDNKMSENFRKRIKLLSSWNHVADIFEALQKRRRKCGREQLLLIGLSAIPVLINYTLIEGVITVAATHSMLFEKYDDYEDYTLYLAIYSCIVEVIGIYIFRSFFQLSDSALGILGFCSLYLDRYIRAFANDRLTFLIGLGLTPLKGFAAIVLRSQYSQIIEKDERGKLFYIYCFAEVLSMFFGYFLFEKLREISTARDEILPNMILAFATILALSTFIFQMMSINTDHIFADCYTTVTLSAENLPDAQKLPQSERR